MFYEAHCIQNDKTLSDARKTVLLVDANTRTIEHYAALIASQHTVDAGSPLLDFIHPDAKLHFRKQLVAVGINYKNISNAVLDVCNGDINVGNCIVADLSYYMGVTYIKFYAYRNIVIVSPTYIYDASPLIQRVKLSLPGERIHTVLHDFGIWLCASKTLLEFAIMFLTIELMISFQPHAIKVFRKITSHMDMDQSFVKSMVEYQLTASHLSVPWEEFNAYAGMCPVIVFAIEYAKVVTNNIDQFYDLVMCWDEVHFGNVPKSMLRYDLKRMGIVPSDLLASLLWVSY